MRCQIEGNQAEQPGRMDRLRVGIWTSMTTIAILDNMSLLRHVVVRGGCRRSAC